MNEFLLKLGVVEADEKAELLHRYMIGVLEWNKKVNLTAITNPEDFVKRHMVDSLVAACCWEMSTVELGIDVGTGAGFPGVPLAICFPHLKMTLLDSTKKRLTIIEELCGELGIRNIETLHGRAEEVGRMKGQRGCYDLCLSRAVATLPMLSEYCMPFVKIGGGVLTYKGANWEEELAESKRAIELTGGQIVRVLRSGDAVRDQRYDLEHRVIVIEKIRETPFKYPRKNRDIKERPL